MNNVIRTGAVFALILSLTACYGGGATSVGGYQPVTDSTTSPAASQGRDYNSDLSACQSLASQRNPVQSGVVGALGGAAVGAAGGAIVGAFTGKPGTGAAIGAGVGGLGGATVGTYQGVQTQEQIVSNCMSQRGWTVLSK